MQNKIQNINISYWFKELDFNPKEKINELQNEFNSIIDTPFLYNEEDIGKLISMPRIEGISKDKKYLFNMSLINANLFIDVGDLDYDDVILLINEKVQVIFDILKDVYDLDIIYTSIKLQMINDNDVNFLKEKLNLKENNYEDLSFKRGFIKDEYYINYIINSGKEYSFNIEKNDNTIENDIYDRTMLISLSDAKMNKEYTSITIEINDRYSYNMNRDYLTSKDVIRGMILELKDILKKESFNEI